MDVITSLVANPEPPEAVDPGEGSFTDPSMATEAFLGLDATSSDPCCDASLAQSHPTASEVVALVRMQLDLTLAWSTSGSLDRSDGIYHLLEHHAVVDICRRVPDRERDAVPVDHNMALRARFAAIRWIRAGLGPPLERAHLLSPAMPETSLSGRPCPIDPEGHGAGLPRLQPLASLEAVANTSHRFHTPFPGATSPRECRFSGRKRCRSEPPGREPGVVRPSVSAALAATTAR